MRVVLCPVCSAVLIARDPSGALARHRIDCAPRCGVRFPGSATIICKMRAGHGGAHQSQHSATRVVTKWVTSQIR